MNFYARETGQKVFKLDEKAKERWLSYHFPGNVRELRNIIIRLIAKYAGQTVNETQLSAELDLSRQNEVDGGARDEQYGDLSGYACSICKMRRT